MISIAATHHNNPTPNPARRASANRLYHPLPSITLCPSWNEVEIPVHRDGYDPSFTKQTQFITVKATGETGLLPAKHRAKPDSSRRSLLRSRILPILSSSNAPNTQNKANLQIHKTISNSVTAKSYERTPLLSTKKNKPNSDELGSNAPAPRSISVKYFPVVLGGNF